jgi:hypothetical protein
MYNKKFSYNNVTTELNKFFKNFNETIQKDVELDKQIKTRIRETSYIDAFTL